MNSDYNYWKEFRQDLTQKLKKEEKIEYKTKEEKNIAIYNMAKTSGIKATARYFNINPSSVRYWVKKFEDN